MSDGPLIAKAECATQFLIERDNDDITLSLKIMGLPDIVAERIVEKGEDMSMVIIQAIMSSIGAIGIQKGPKEVITSNHKESVH